MLARRTRLEVGRYVCTLNKRSCVQNQGLLNGADSVVKSLSVYCHLSTSGRLFSTCQVANTLEKPRKSLLDSSLIGQNPHKLWETKSTSCGQNMHKVWDIQTVKGKPREDEARRILEEVATQVEPIMIKHGWRVELLSEYFGHGNRMIRGGDFTGQKTEIRLRLRHFSEELEFIPFIVIMDTMLYGLCQIAHPNFGACFHKLWNQLRKEYEEFVIAGTIKASSKEFDLGVVFLEPWEKITERLVKNTVSYGQNMDKVWAIQYMKKMPRQDEARRILEEVARQVEPIMVKHGCRIKLLSEFRKGFLLGKNSRGQYIELRLRRMLSKDEFIPFILIMDTMLQQLCHIVHEDHNASFRDFLGQLRKEYEEFVSEGIIQASSEEFDLRGPRLAERLAESVRYSENDLLTLCHGILVAVNKAISRFRRPKRRITWVGIRNITKKMSQPKSLQSGC